MGLGQLIVLNRVQHLREAERRRSIASSDYVRGTYSSSDVLDIGDPRSGVSLGECPYSYGAERSNQKEPKQALRSVSEATREVKANQPGHTTRMTVNRANAMTEPNTY